MFCCSIPSGWTYQTLHRDSKPRTSFINHIFAPLLFLCVLVLSHVSLPHPIWISGLDMEGWPWFVKLMLFPPVDPLPPSSGLSLYGYLVDKFESLTCHRCILEFPGADLKTSTWISWLGLPCSLFYAQFNTQTILLNLNTYSSIRERMLGEKAKRWNEDKEQLLQYCAFTHLVAFLHKENKYFAVSRAYYFLFYLLISKESVIER